MNQWEFLLWVLTFGAAVLILVFPLWMVVYCTTQAYHIAKKDAYAKKKPA